MEEAERRISEIEDEIMENDEAEKKRDRKITTSYFVRFLFPRCISPYSKATSKSFCGKLTTEFIIHTGILW